MGLREEGVLLKDAAWENEAEAKSRPCYQLVDKFFSFFLTQFLPFYVFLGNWEISYSFDYDS